MIRFACIGLAFLCAVPASAAPEDLRDVLGKVTTNVKSVAESLGQSSVRIGDFSARGQDEQTGRRIASTLSELLGNFAQPTSKLEIGGEFGFVDQPAANGEVLKVIQIRLKMIDTTTLEDVKEFLPKKAVIRDTATIASLTGATFRTDPDGGLAQRNKDLDKARQRPTVFVSGPMISAAADSPFAVEILAGPSTATAGDAPPPRNAVVVGGKAFVPIAVDEVYQIRLHNRSAIETAVAIAIDGIDVFSFSDDRVPDGKPKFAHYIVSPNSSVVIPGWHKSIDSQRSDNFLEFLVTHAGKGAASKFPTQSKGKVGTITISFSTVLPPAAAAKTAGSETTTGRAFKGEQTELQRTIEPPHEFLTIRYNRE